MNAQVIEKMKDMKLSGMLRAFETSLAGGAMERLTADEMVSFLVEAEWDERSNRKMRRSITNARFRYQAGIEQIDFDHERNIEKNQILRLAECLFIQKKENILITGSTGIGKSYLASALGHQACCLGYRVMYAHTAKLFARLKMAKADGSYVKEIARIERRQLLIVDDFGLQPMDGAARSALMEIIEDRHGKGSTIITSQLPVSTWHELIGEQTVADAVMDRLVHNAHRIELEGESLRKKLKNS